MAVCPSLYNITLLTERLGKLIYEVLDWGIESYGERAERVPGEANISYAQLSTETTKSSVTFQDVIKYLGRMDVKDCSARQKADDQARLWQDILGDLQKGVRLHKVMEQPQRRIFIEGSTHSSYSTVVDDIKNKLYTLQKLS
ncbi:protein spire homolog 1-like [Rhineura floridana]|uniref:protein spire homolog 1-like n=1 Tax=Rhineura floridana TaxID=261503 RepID=UPI002AC82FA9|nr:protein spire homolog 1-like [Rhineura floridana]